MKGNATNGAFNVLSLKIASYEFMWNLHVNQWINHIESHVLELKIFKLVWLQNLPYKGNYTISELNKEKKLEVGESSKGI